MKKHTLLTICFCTVVFAGQLLAFGGHEGKRGGFNREAEHLMRFAHVAETLDLTDQQKNDMRKIIDETVTALTDIGLQRFNNSQDIRAFHDAETIDQSALETLANAQGDLVAQGIILKTNALFNLRSTLTDEQLEEIKKRMHHMRQRKKN